MWCLEVMNHALQLSKCLLVAHALEQSLSQTKTVVLQTREIDTNCMRVRVKCFFTALVKSEIRCRTCLAKLGFAQPGIPRKSEKTTKLGKKWGEILFLTIVLSA